MRAAEGYTLVELMIVLVIIGIVAAILIPSILESRISANETSASSSLNTIAKTDNIFRQNDPDGNGRSDYWTENVWGLYGVKTPGGNPIQQIPEGLARADYEGVEDQSAIKSSGLVSISTSNGDFQQKGDEAPNSGYFVSMFTGKSSTGTGCNSFSSNSDCYDDGDAGGEGATCSGNGTGSFTNLNRFSAMAFPAQYSLTGVKAYVTNHRGTIHSIDAKDDSGTNKPFIGPNNEPRTTAGKAPVECMPSADVLGSEWTLVD